MRLEKQPKVHRIPRRKKRYVRTGRAFLSVGFTFLIAGAIGVLGYSVAKPILEFADGSDTSTDSAQIQTVETPAVASETEILTAAVTEEATEEATALQGTAVGVRLSETALESKTTLQEAVADARKIAPDGTVLVLPLKTTGGEIWYQTDVSLAVQCGAVKGPLTLSEITTIVSAEGWTPVASCSLLSDQLLPDADADAGYRIEGDGSRWLDNTKENGGKPCANPFSTVTQQYLCDLVKEMTAAGFSQIWCEDVTFPAFRTSDLELLGSQVQDSSARGEILTALLNQLVDAAGDTPVLLCADGTEARNGTVEALQQLEQLEVSGIVLGLGTDTAVAQTLQWAAETAPGLSLWMMADASEAATETVPDAVQEASAGWIWERN